MAHSDPAARKQIASIGALAKIARHDGPPAELTAKAKRGADEKWLREARASLPPDATEYDVVRRADVLRRLHLKRAAYKSAETRRKRKSAFVVESGE